MDPALIRPSLSDHGEVPDVVRHECKSFSTASRQQRLVVLELPAEFADRMHIMTSIMQADRDHGE